MRNSSRPISAFRILSLGILLLALILAVLQLVRFSRVRTNFPAGLVIAGVPVGGLDRPQAAERLLSAYSAPVVLHYNDAVINLNPSVIDYQLDVESMLAAGDLERTRILFWQEFWDFLWGRTSTPNPIPLRATYSEQRLRTFLEDISMRYDQPPQAALPVAGSVTFQPGKAGFVLDEDGAVVLIEKALFSLDQREAVLPLQRSEPSRPPLENLKTLLKQTLEVEGFEGLAGIYMEDLQTGQELHFAYQDGQDITVNPDVAFTASSIIKIPIMVSALRRIQDNSDPETQKLLGDMVDLSGNEAADWLMDRVIDNGRGPLVVSEDMTELGLENTFLAGKFSIGSPLLAVVKTPANQRIDVSTDPDPYSQTTPSDIGMLLSDIYQCAQSNGGSLIAVFAGDIDPSKCQQMINLLVNNKLPSLLTAGIPEGTRIGHKHGWVSTNGIINTIGDAGIIYSPAGNYVFVVFLHNPDQLVWEPASNLIADLSTAVYNYFNLPQSSG